MKNFFSLICLGFSLLVNAQDTHSIKGKLIDENQTAVAFANLALHSQADSSLVKVETTDLDGLFEIRNISKGDYFLKVLFVGYDELNLSISVIDQDVDLATQSILPTSVELQTATITAKRAMVEVKPDRTVFNVQGTINAAGDNGLELLRKAPGVILDNNDNINVLGRAGVLVYVDGKRLPLSGDDLTNYLRNLTADQIDRIDIISNPGAKYEAEGNAGIIDIRLKKNENHGMNGSLSNTTTVGRRERYNNSFNGNYRNAIMNVYGMASYYHGTHFENFSFRDFQNGLDLQKKTDLDLLNKTISYRLGTDFYLGNNQTVGFLINGSDGTQDGVTTSRDVIARTGSMAGIDSILIAGNNFEGDQKSNTFNINYVSSQENNSLNIDLDYGRYRNETYYEQPNAYFNENETELLSRNDVENDTPVKIDIYTFKVDYETNALNGKLGIGTKLSRVNTNNTFLFYNVPVSTPVFNDRRSNIFDYDEKVYALYAQYNRTLNEKWALSAGLRSETTDAQGDLTAFIPELEEDPVELDYTDLFPSFGLTYSLVQGNTWAFNIGRRINRPDYNVLNPFEWQISEISFSKGNPNLQPEIVNNVELGYTLKWRYNFKLSYSITTNQITRLIAPDDRDVRAGFINWDNLAEQRIVSFNISAPVTITNWWNAYVNINAIRQDNQADYGDGDIIDLQAFSYSLYQQQTFTLPKGYTVELSGWFSGPGIWGGVFLYNESWALNIGVQKKFFQDRLNVKLTANDIFYEAWWDGYSEFGGLRSEGMGLNDTQNVSLSLTYSFGNNKVKSRDRQTGLEAESNRVGG